VSTNTAQISIENSAQTTFNLTPIRYRVPSLSRTKCQQGILR